MPRIEEYLPEVNASGPVGDIAPNLDQVGAYGRGLQTFGNDALESVDLINRRQEQAEVSQASASFSEARSNFLDQIQQQTNDGTLNVDKVKQQYQEFVDQQSDQYSTAGGKDYFNKMQARVGSTVLQKAIRGQQTVTFNNTKANFQQTLNSDSDALMKSPDSFEDVHNGAVQTIDSYVKAGSLTPAQATQMQQEVGQEYSKAAVRGWAMNGPDGPTQAQHMLDNGGFDQYLDSDQKKQMYGEVQGYQRAADTESTRQQAIQDAAQAERAEQWGQGALSKLKTNSLSTDQIMRAPLSWEDKYRWLNMVQAASKQELVTNPALKNSLIQRMTLPDSAPNKISDPSQLQKYVGKGLSTQDYDQLNTWFDKTPQGQVLTQNRKMLIDLAKSNLVKGGGIMGQPDPNGEYQLMQFTNALQNQEANLRSQNQPLTSLYDVNSPQFFGKQISNYRKTPEQLMQEQFGKPGQSPAPTNIQTQPGVIPSDKKTPPPGLSLEEFKQWKRSNGQ